MPMTAQAAHKEMIWDGDTLIYRLQVSPDGWFYVNDQPTGKATDVNGGWPTAPEHFGMQMADLFPLGPRSRRSGRRRVRPDARRRDPAQLPHPHYSRRRVPVGDRGGSLPGLRPSRPRAPATGPAPRPVTKRRNLGRVGRPWRLPYADALTFRYRPLACKECGSFRLSAACGYAAHDDRAHRVALVLYGTWMAR